MWCRRFAWPNITVLCSGEDQDILVDGVSKGEVCSKREQERLYHQHDGGFVAVGLSGGPSEGLFGVKGTRLGPDSWSNTSELGRSPLIPADIVVR